MKMVIEPDFELEKKKHFSEERKEILLRLWDQFYKHRELSLMWKISKNYEVLKAWA